MHTATTLYLRVTLADACYSKPIRLMPDDEWRKYLDRMFNYFGFDRTRPIRVVSHVPGFEAVFAQDRAPAYA